MHNRYSGLKNYIKEPNELFNELKDETIVFFDTETTGLNESRNQITEIAAVAVSGPDFKVIDEFDVKISLSEKTLRQIEEEKPKYVDPKFYGVEKALKMNKYFENKNRTIGELEAVKEFKSFLEKHGNPILIAHNANFDMKFIGSRGVSIPKKRVYDTMQFAKYYLIPSVITLSEKEVEEEKERKNLLTTVDKKNPEITYLSASLDKLIDAFQIEKGSLHTARVDVAMMAKVFKEMMGYFKKYTEVHKDPKYKEEQHKKMVQDRFKNLSKGKQKYLKNKKNIIDKVKSKLDS